MFVVVFKMPFLHCSWDWEFPFSLWHNIGFNTLDFFSNQNSHDWLKLVALGSQAFIFSVGIWWS
jgi:hypothetical protein